MPRTVSLVSPDEIKMPTKKPGKPGQQPEEKKETAGQGYGHAIRRFMPSFNRT